MELLMDCLQTVTRLKGNIIIPTHFIVKIVFGDPFGLLLNTSFSTRLPLLYGYSSVCVWLLLLPKLQRVNEYKAIVVENGNYGKLQSLICLLFYKR